MKRKFQNHLSINFTICGLATKIENRRKLSGWHGYTKESDSTEANNGKSKSVSPLTRSGTEVCVSGLLVEGRSFSIEREKSGIPARETQPAIRGRALNRALFKSFSRKVVKKKRDESSLWKLATQESIGSWSWLFSF